MKEQVCTYRLNFWQKENERKKERDKERERELKHIYMRKVNFIFLLNRFKFWVFLIYSGTLFHIFGPLNLRQN